MKTNALTLSQRLIIVLCGFLLIFLFGFQSNGQGSPAKNPLSSDSYHSANLPASENLVNQPPVANADSYTVHGSFETPIEYPYTGVLKNDSDPENDLLQTTGTDIQTSLGRAIVYNNGKAAFLPNFGATGSVTVPYTVCDTNGGCDSSTVTFNIVNQPPSAVKDVYFVKGDSFETQVNGQPPFGILNNDTDPENDPLSSIDTRYDIPNATTPDSTVIIYSNGKTGYIRQNPYFSGRVTVPYTSCDNLGGCSQSTITFFVLDRGDDGNAGAACPLGNVGEPVNVTNGNMWLRQSDYQLPGIGAAIDLTRTYNSLRQTSGIFGFGWANQYDQFIAPVDNGLVKFYMADGRAVYFGRTDSTGAFTPVDGADVHASIVKNTDNTYTLTFKNGSVYQFNAGGRLLWQQDRNGNQTTLNYDTNGNLAGITDAFNRTLTVTSNANGTVDHLSDSIGTAATYEYYPGTTLLKTVTYADGSQYKFEYDSTTVSGKVFLKTVKDALDNVLETHGYDSQGRATTSEKAGGVEKYTLDYSNSAYTTATDALGRTTKYTFDKSRGRNVITQVEGNCGCGSGSQTTSYEYDNQLNLVKKVDALGREMTFTYDGSGNRLTTTDKIGTTGLGTETYTYNNFGDVLTRTDKMNGITTSSYDTNGNLKTVTDALGYVTTVNYPVRNNRGLPDSIKDARLKTTKFRWFSSGLLQEVEDANGKKTAYTYDARGRIKTATDALLHTTTYNYYDDATRKVEMIYPNADKITYKYDVRSLLESVTDERGKITGYEFDAARRLVKITDPLLHVRQFDYDLMSNKKWTKDALGIQTDYLYDDYDRLKEIDYPAAAAGAARLKEKFEYDAVGRVKKYYDTANRLTEYGYDDTGRTTTVTNPELEVITTKYNARGQIIEVKDALNQIYTFSNDPLGRLLSQTRAGTTMSYEYDAVSNRTKRTDYTGRITDYGYDNLNRLTQINYLQSLNGNAPPTPIKGASYGYNDLSQLTTATNEAGTVSFDYDNRHRMKTTIDVFGHTLDYEYELTPTVNQKRLKLDGTLYAKYNYDDANRPANLFDPADSTTIAFSYDNAGKLSSRSYPNGITTTFDYDGIDRLKRLKDVSTTATLFDRQYDYNDASQISQIVEPANTRTLSYDLADRLKTVAASNNQNESYNFDGGGNRTSSHKSTSYGYQPFNRLTSTATANYSYDANGNMLSKFDAAGNWTYGWDYENRMTTARNRNKIVRYQYDALGRRVSRLGKGVGATAKYTYDGMDVILDDGSEGIVKYQNGFGVDDKLKLTANGSAKYFLHDHLGSTVGLADSSGNILSSASYDSYGNSTNNLTTRYQYTGREKDEFTGLMYYRARWYDSNLGRFISEDPIGLAGGVNTYGYIANNPLGGTDSMGLDPEWDRQLWRAQQDLIEAALPAIEFGVGFGDEYLAFPRYVRKWQGIDDPTLDCSVAYQAGQWVAIAAQVAEAGVGLYKVGLEISGKYAARKGFGAAEELAAGCLRCFEAETEVQTDKGLKPIEKIETGDKVLSYNEGTRLLEYQAVTAKFTRYADDIYSVSVEGESQSLGITSEHPFFVRIYRARDNLISNDEDDGEWRETQNLQVGDEIKLADGNWAKVLDLKFKGAGAVYNFTVAGNHNYFVGDLRLLTHNAGCWTSTNSKSSVENAFSHWRDHKGEFPEFNNAKEYAEKAKDFVTSPPSGALTKARGADTLVYDAATNTFGVNRGGVPATMFRPTDGMNYWLRQ